MPTFLSKNKLSYQAQKLMDFINANYGKKIISGQMTCTWNYNIDSLEYVFRDTGKYPAIAGFDFMNMLEDVTPEKLNERGEILGQDGKYHSRHGHLEIQKAEEWHKKGGIVTFCWHWYVKGANGKNAFYASNENGWITDFRIPYDTEKSKPESDLYLLNKESPYFKTILNDCEKVSSLLSSLKNKNIPVLWRPLHEASGGWFWWGRGNDNEKYKAESFIALWRWMVDYFEAKGLDNLIWVYNGQNKGWYPGDNYCDIIGEDIYASVLGKTDLSSQKERFFNASLCQEKSLSIKKPITLSETGTIPDIDNCIKDNCLWSWFMVWNDCRFSNNRPVGDDGNFWSGELHNPLSHRKAVYNDARVITLKEVKLE